MLKIRHVQPYDIFPVIALAYETLPERYNPAIFNQFYEAFPEGFLVALQDNTIIGFLVGIRTNQTTARILMLSVKEMYRRQGIGTALLLHFLNEMSQQNISRIDLEVRTRNKSAFEFYKKHGFRLQKILQSFYQNGQDAYKMIKEL